jgi:hypothetical protein
MPKGVELLVSRFPSLTGGEGARFYDRSRRFARMGSGGTGVDLPAAASRHLRAGQSASRMPSGWRCKSGGTSPLGSKEHAVQPVGMELALRRLSAAGRLRTSGTKGSYLILVSKKAGGFVAESHVRA